MNPVRLFGEDRRVPDSTPRLVATDLDGTIVRRDLTISDRTVAALQGVEALGIPVVLVTGRPARWLAVVADRLGHTGLAVCANGAVLYDLHTETVVWTEPLAVDVGLEVAHRIRAAVPGVAFAVETATGFGHEPTYLARYDAGLERAVAPVEELFTEPALKLLARHEAMTPDELVAAAREVVGDLVEVTHSATESALLEISAAGVSKASGLARFATSRGIDAADVVAFGDMPNDLPMLAWAGLAYGVRDGHPDVLAAVAHRVDPPELDGVARTLESLFAL